jgi:hypothetical protein
MFKEHADECIGIKHLITPNFTQRERMNGLIHSPALLELGKWTRRALVSPAKPALSCYTRLKVFQEGTQKVLAIVICALRTAGAG